MSTIIRLFSPLGLSFLVFHLVFRLPILIFFCNPCCLSPFLFFFMPWSLPFSALYTLCILAFFLRPLPCEFWSLYYENCYELEINSNSPMKLYSHSYTDRDLFSPSCCWNMFHILLCFLFFIFCLNLDWIFHNKVLSCFFSFL